MISQDDTIMATQRESEGKPLSTAKQATNLRVTPPTIFILGGGSSNNRISTHYLFTSIN